MTTRTEIQNWVRPLLDSTLDLVLERDLLLVRPVRHLLRGVYFWPSSSRDLPNIGWFMIPLFDAPTPSRGLRLSNEIPVGSSAGSGFSRLMEERVRWSLESYVGPVDTIQKLRDYAVVERPPSDGGFSARTLDKYPREYAPVLSALGLLDEARSILRPALVRDETYFRGELNDGQALLAKRSNSRAGKSKVEFANFHLPILAELRNLLVFLDQEDRAAIAALLHEWERQNVAKWGVEHLWEPTPFPVETQAD